MRQRVEAGFVTVAGADAVDLQLFEMGKKYYESTAVEYE